MINKLDKYLKIRTDTLKVGHTLKNLDRYLKTWTKSLKVGQKH